MSNPYFPAHRIRVSREDLLYTYRQVMIEDLDYRPHPLEITALVAHVWKESGGAMYCYNVGNLKAGAGWTGGVTWYQGNEVLGGRVYWADFSPTWVPRHGWINRFRAYPTLRAGVSDYLQQLCFGRFAPARKELARFNLLPSPPNPTDVEEVLTHFVRTLAETRYMTADPAQYAKTYLTIFRGVERCRIPTVPPAHPVMQPAGVDPIQAPVLPPDLALIHPVQPGQRFRTRPPLGEPPAGGHCHAGACAKGIYAHHMGYTLEQEPLPPLVRGYEGEGALPDAPSPAGRVPTAPVPGGSLYGIEPLPAPGQPPLQLVLPPTPVTPPGPTPPPPGLLSVRSAASRVRSLPLETHLDTLRRTPKGARRTPAPTAPPSAPPAATHPASGWRPVLPTVQTPGVSGLPSTLRPALLAVGPAPSGGDWVPVHPSPPRQADVWLRVWTLGREEREGWTGADLLRPSPGECVDLLCAEVPGAVVEQGAALRFCPLGSVVPVGSPSWGWIDLVHDVGAAPLRVPLRAAGNAPTVHVVVELCPQPGGSGLPPGRVGLRLLNLAGVLHSQVEEGGLVAGFVLHYAGMEKVPNDLGFGGFGRDVAALTHSLCLDAQGELCVGYGLLSSDSPFGAYPNGLARVVEAIARLRAVAAQALGRALQDVRVRRLYTLTHGLPTSLMVGSQQHWLGLRGADGKANPMLEPALVALGAEHLTPDAVWSQMSCSVGASPSAPRTTGDFGRAPGATAAVAAAVGQGSFADTCRRRIDEAMDRARGQQLAPGVYSPVGQVAVWGHTSKGSALFNAELRAFTRQGNLDLCWMLEGWPTDLRKDADRQKWSLRFMNHHERAHQELACWLFVPISLSHPGALIAQRLQTLGQPTAPPPSPSVQPPVQPSVLPGAPVLPPRPTQSLPWPPGPGVLLPAAPPSPLRGTLPTQDPEAMAPRLLLDLDASPGARRCGRDIVRGLDAAGLDVVWKRTGSREAEIAARDAALLAELRAGNMPTACFQWVPVPLQWTGAKGQVLVRGRAYVQSDVLAVGIDEDFVRVNLSGRSSEQLAQAWGCYLPTRVLLIAALRAVGTARRLAHPMNCAGRYGGLHQMSNRAMLTHDELVQGWLACDRAAWPDLQKRWSGRFDPATPNGAHRGRCQIAPGPAGGLQIGHKKEVCLVDPRSWRPDGKKPPMLNFCGFVGNDSAAGAKPFGLFADGYGSQHDWLFTDYAQGTRLVYPRVEVEDLRGTVPVSQVMDYAEVLQHPEFFRLLSAEPYTAPEQTRYPS